MIEVPSLARIRAALELGGASPRRSFGQHFLTDPAILNRIVDAAELEPHEPVLEVGPGPGVLTANLLNRGATVVALEADRAMIEALRELIGEPPGLSVLRCDALAERPAPPRAARELLARPRPENILASASTPTGDTPRYAFVANLPYQIASPLLVDVLQSFPPRVAVVMVQREVANRMRARPGEPDYGVLSVHVALAGTVEEVMRLRAGAFWPPPRVESSCIRIVPHPRQASMMSSADSEGGLDPAVVGIAIRRAFGERRKTLLNCLSRESRAGRDDLASAIRSCGIDPAARAEQLPPDAFPLLARVLRRIEGAPEKPQPPET